MRATRRLRRRADGYGVVPDVGPPDELVGLDVGVDETEGDGVGVGVGLPLGEGLGLGELTPGDGLCRGWGGLDCAPPGTWSSCGGWT